MDLESASRGDIFVGASSLRALVEEDFVGVEY